MKTETKKRITIILWVLFYLIGAYAFLTNRGYLTDFNEQIRLVFGGK